MLYPTFWVFPSFPPCPPSLNPSSHTTSRSPALLFPKLGHPLKPFLHRYLELWDLGPNVPFVIRRSDTAPSHGSGLEGPITYTWGMHQWLSRLLLTMVPPFSRRFVKARDGFLHRVTLPISTRGSSENGAGKGSTTVPRWLFARLQAMR